MKNRFIPILLIIIIALAGCTINKDQNQSQTKKSENQTKDQLEKNITTPKIIVKKTVDYDHNQLKKQITMLNKSYDSIRVTSIGKSIANRNLYLLKLGTGSKKIAVIGGVHGRENLTSLLILKLLEDYTRNLKKENLINNYNLTKILNKITFYFIPMLNPDGIEIAINGLKKTPKNKGFYIQANKEKSNFKRWKANGRGVDLNKQFPAHWQELDSENKPHFAHYKGPTPLSEPESKALAKLTKKENFFTVVAFHSSGSVIYWYYNQQAKEYKRDYQLAKRISAQNGYELVKPTESDQKAAGYKDWFIKEFNRPGFTIEIGEKEEKQEPLPASKLNKYFKENRTVLLELAKNI
ncbi:M14 family zinc carboxypeptidase [Halanaerocella petrolearia]